MTTNHQDEPEQMPDAHTSTDAAPPSAPSPPEPTAPPSAPTLSWNTRKAPDIRKRLEEEGITWQDPPTEAWLKTTEAALRRQGNPMLGQQLKGAVIRRTPPTSRPMGREQQQRTQKAANAQDAKQRRGTVTDDRGRPVSRKLPMSTLLGAGLAGAVLLGLIGYGGVSAYQSSAREAAARRAEAQARESASGSSPTTVSQVAPADPNAVVANPSQDPEIVKATPLSEEAPIPEAQNPDGTPKESSVRSSDTAPPDTQGQQDAYAQGKRDGELAGFAGGQREGYTQGKREGTQTGYQQGVREGQQQGAQAGYQQGVKDGQQQAARTPTPSPAAQQGAPVRGPVPVTAATPPQSTVRVSAPAPANGASPVPTTGKMTFNTAAQPPQSAPPRLTFSSSGGSGGDSAQSATPVTRGVTMVTNPAAATSAAGSNTAGFSLRAAPQPQAVDVGGRLVMVGAAQPAPGTPTANGATSPEAGGTITKQYGDVSMVFQNRGTAPATGSAAPTSAPVTEAAAVSAPATAAPAPTFGPYRPYQTIRARLETAVLVMEGARTNLNVIARSSDGRKWIGTSSIAGAQRVHLTFTQMVDLDGQTVLNVPAVAYDANGVPGIQGSGQDLAPDVVRNLIRNAATGVRDYAQAQLNASRTTITPNGQVVVEKDAPSLWTLVGGRALSVFDLPENTRTFTRATYLPSGTDVVLMIGAQPIKE